MAHVGITQVNLHKGITKLSAGLPGFGLHSPFVISTKLSTREVIEAGEKGSEKEPVPRRNRGADIFTKILPPKDFLRLRSQLMYDPDACE